MKMRNLERNHARVLDLPDAHQAQGAYPHTSAEERAAHVARWPADSDRGRRPAKGRVRFSDQVRNALIGIRPGGGLMPGPQPEWARGGGA